MSFGEGGPGRGPGGPGGPQQQSQSPDWGALADQAAASRTQRRRWLLIGGGALATAAIAVVVALAVVTQSDSESGTSDSTGALPTAESLPPGEPDPTFSDVKPPPPPDPRDYITDAAKDTAPLTPRTLFPDRSMGRDGRTLTKASTDVTRGCAAAAPGALGTVLREHDCGKLLRATYAQGDVAVTVGVAVFPSGSAASGAAQEAKGSIQPLPGGDVPAFCRGVVCRSTTNVLGRYVYFTISGYTNGDSVTEDETEAMLAGRDGSEYAFRRIMARGQAQASAAAVGGR